MLNTGELFYLIDDCQQTEASSIKYQVHTLLQSHEKGVKIFFRHDRKNVSIQIEISDENNKSALMQC